MPQAALFLLAILLALAPDARAAEKVDAALVLVDDVSRSIDDGAFKLQKEGYYAAFTDPTVLAAIHDGRTGRTAVAYVEFAAAGQVRTVLNWAVIKDGVSARAFADAIRAAPRLFQGRTAIGEGISQAMSVLSTLPFQAERRVVDVCGDGINNSGRPVATARDDAIKQDVTINGLAVANESHLPWLQAHTHPPGGLANYYRENVTSGEGSFVLEIHSYQSFAKAVRRKLIEEIAVGGRLGNPAHG